MSGEAVLLLRLFGLVGLILGLEQLLLKRQRRKRVRARAKIPAKWRRAIDRTYGVTKGVTHVG